MHATLPRRTLTALSFLLTFTASAGYAQSADPYPFAVSVSGSVDAPPMLLIPGLMSSGEVWASLVADYGTTHRLHVVTLPGFAGQPPLGPGPVLPRVRDALIRYVRDEHLTDVILIGHSVGGFLALSMAATAPDLFAAVVSVDGLPFLPAVYDPSATATGTAPVAEQMMTMYRSMTREQLKEQARLSLASMIAAPADVDRATEWAGRSDPDTVGRVASEMYTTDLRPALAAIRAPVLVVAAGAAVPDAMRSSVTSAYRAQVANVPHATVVMADRARHFVMLDDPAFLRSAIDQFLGDRQTR